MFIEIRYKSKVTIWNFKTFVIPGDKTKTADGVH